MSSVKSKTVKKRIKTTLIIKLIVEQVCSV